MPESALPPGNPNSDTPEKNGLPPVSPDKREQELLDQIDNIVPSRGYDMLPVVALGGSAGGIQALEAFFDATPPDTGIAFVVVLHLSPEHESALTEVLQPCTTMPVVRVKDAVEIEPNKVYVIPPGKYLTAHDGYLRLTDLQAERGKRLTVDHFLRSLADTHGAHAVAVILSGADSDGAIGLKRIKERGGLTIAQDPDEAQHSGMPRAAIDTGMVDWVLRTTEMPGRILQYNASERSLKLPPEDGPQPALPVPPTPDKGEVTLREVLAYLRQRTGRDFTYYKRATILRRISRRMQINSVHDLAEYLGYLRTHPGESGALLQDLLISVTNFFRDRESFEALELQIPDLFKGKAGGDSVRVWVPACATGEEAYSITILLLEYARRLDNPPNIQVFGCDLDEAAIQAARSGVYPGTIASDVSEERLRRFFMKEHNAYRVRREVRELVLFAPHDLLKDAPFSRMDLVSCRNLLIYLNREAQERALHIFHFALKPNGRLFLGSSESVEEGSPLFTPLDKKHRIYLQRPAQRLGFPVPSGPTALRRAIEEQERLKEGPVVHGRSFLPNATVAHAEAAPIEERIPLGELHFKLIERFAPPSVVVNTDYEIVHLSDNAGRFLTFVGGQPTTNLLRVVHPALRVELRAALGRAAESAEQVEVFDLPVEIEGAIKAVNIRVAPARELAPGFLLVVFDAHAPVAQETTGAPAMRAETEPVAQHLERELERANTRLRNTVEQYEASTEELKASNEELQAMNEELRSATEELETSREELQSINEELTTVNHELKSKVEELGRVNSDLQNLMAASAIATVFLDRDMQIMRYTPSAVPLFNLIPGDVGRPIAHLKHRLDYPELAGDAEKVLRNLVPVEREVRDNARWYLARLLPYRTVEDQIAGVVLTFVEITENKRAGEALRQSEERMRLLLESAQDYAIFTIDTDRRVNSWNAGAQAMCGYSESEIVGQLGDIVFTPEDRERGMPVRELEQAIKEGRGENERWHMRKDGSRFWGSGLTRPLRDASGSIIGFVKIMRDLTEKRQTEEALRVRNDELERFNRAAVGRELRMVELKKEINALLTQSGEPSRYKVNGEDPES